jgi:hypothetical protein
MVKPHNYKYCSERVWFTELSHQYLHKRTSAFFLQAHHLTQSCYDSRHTQTGFKLTNITIYTGSDQLNYTINQKITLKTNILHISKTIQQCFSNFFTGEGGCRMSKRKKEEHKSVGFFFVLKQIKSNKITLKLSQRLIHQNNNTNYCMLMSWWVGWGYFDEYKLEI